MFTLKNEADLEKLKAIINGKYTGQVMIAKELIAELVAKLKKTAADMGISFRYKQNPSEGKILIYMGAGCIAGGILGGAVAGLPGVLVGSGVGAIIGLCSTRIEIVFDAQAAMYSLFIKQ